jgi:hypothetical protein
VSESGCQKGEQRSALEALWALGALEPKKWLKLSDGGLGSGAKVAEKQAPRAAVFCHLFTGNPPHMKRPAQEALQSG